MSVIKGFCYFFLVLAIVLALVTIYVRNTKSGNKYFIVKCFSSSVFVFLAIFACLETDAPKELVLFIISGLLFGFLGDAILGAKEINKVESKKPFIVAGILAFLIGHVLFSVGFIIYAGINLYVFIIPLILSIIALIGFIMLKYTVKVPLYALLVIYAFFETLMSASSGYLMSLNFNPGYIVAFVGSIFFCVSDSVLSYIYFGPIKKYKNILVLIELTTYYSAQILIASSIIFM